MAEALVCNLDSLLGTMTHRVCVACGTGSWVVLCDAGHPGVGAEAFRVHSASSQQGGKCMRVGHLPCSPWACGPCLSSSVWAPRLACGSAAPTCSSPCPQNQVSGASLASSTRFALGEGAEPAAQQVQLALHSNEGVDAWALLIHVQLEHPSCPNQGGQG